MTTPRLVPGRMTAATFVVAVTLALPLGLALLLGDRWYLGLLLLAGCALLDSLAARWHEKGVGADSPSPWKQMRQIRERVQGWDRR